MRSFFIQNSESSVGLRKEPQRFYEVAAAVLRLVQGPAPRWWWVGLVGSAGLLMVGLVAAGETLRRGLGLWGLNRPVMWGWAIVNFVWWIGIAHAGTLLSAILLLLRQSWRSSLHRVAETMTLLAVICAAAFPLLHLGRAWLVWWMAPVHNAHAIWPQFRSPLLWDAFAIGTYFVVSLLFWYHGLVPDLAIARDRARTPLGRWWFGLLAVGWTGSTRQWYYHREAGRMLAGLATALVVAVHSIVSLDFAVSVLPGWHETIFPPYFVAGAIFSGCALVITLAVPLWQWTSLRRLIRPEAISALSKVMLLAGMIVIVTYDLEAQISRWSSDSFERARLNIQLGSPDGMIMVAVGILFLPLLLLFFRSIQRRPWWIWTIALGVDVGMWLERRWIVVGALSRDFLPSSWGGYTATVVDVLCFLGSVGFFLVGLFLFLRWFPAVGIADWWEERLERIQEPGEGGLEKEKEWVDRRFIEIGGRKKINPNRVESSSGKGGVWFIGSDAKALEKFIAQLPEDQTEDWEVYSVVDLPGVRARKEWARLGGEWVFLAGLFGAGMGLGMIGYMNGWDYPLIVAGKPFFHFIPAVPVAFALTILFASLAVFGLWFRRSRFPDWADPVANGKIIQRPTRFDFLLWLSEKIIHRPEVQRLIEGAPFRRVDPSKSTEQEK